MVSDPHLVSLYPRFRSLNPCFNGRWSLTDIISYDQCGEYEDVLILVLMEDGL